MNNKESSLKVSMFEQATVFLERAGEFYPYGVFINKNGVAIPVGVYDDKDYLPSAEVITILEDNLYRKIKNNESTLVGIGVDVKVNEVIENNEVVKKDALMIKISKDGKNWKEEYYTYQINNNIVIWR
ncbi:MAG: hypothetical protein GW810_12475 [Flavobacteriales bacterium]|nr:hypothetical protein [Bacteroidota bacterium]NCQ15588.1 hypothetical protein [Flavobacteriales bacterium]